MKSSLRGIFLTSETPALIARFYKDVAGLDLERVGAEGQYQYWKIDTAGMQLAIHDARLFAHYTYPVCLESNVTHLYFKIESQREFLDHLHRLGITPHCTDEIVITVVDPDGRKVMFGTA